MPNLIKLKCANCGHEWYAGIVDGKATCPHCAEENKVFETTEGLPASSEGADDKRYRAVNSAGESSEIEGDK